MTDETLESLHAQLAQVPEFSQAADRLIARIVAVSSRDLAADRVASAAGVTTAGMFTIPKPEPTAEVEPEPEVSIALPPDYIGYERDVSHAQTVARQRGLDPAELAPLLYLAAGIAPHETLPYAPDTTDAAARTAAEARLHDALRLQHGIAAEDVAEVVARADRVASQLGLDRFLTTTRRHRHPDVVRELVRLSDRTRKGGA
jgi:hypothetical protein